MEVIPAIDLRGGRTVRLYQGDFERETVYDDDPVAVARRWAEQGAPRLHVVDLDGAREGRPVHGDLIGAIVRAVAVPVQVGGGLRTLADMESILALGVQRVVLGTAAIEDPGLVRRACARFGEAIVVGIDIREGRVAVRGWRVGSPVNVPGLARSLVGLGVRRLVHTDIGRDGTLQGPNLAALEELVRAVPVPVVASGGVTSMDDVRRLASLGVEGVIVGRALYTGALSLPEALAVGEAAPPLTGGPPAGPPPPATAGPRAPGRRP